MNITINFCSRFEKETKRNSERVYYIVFGLIKYGLFLCAFSEISFNFVKGLGRKA